MFDPLRRGHSVGRRFRCVVRVPGRGLRSPRRFVFSAETLRNRNRAPDRSPDAHRSRGTLGMACRKFFLPWPAWLGIAVVAALLGYEHSLVKADDLSRLDAAFFAMNGYIVFRFCSSGERQPRSGRFETFETFAEKAACRGAALDGMLINGKAESS